MAQTDLPLSVAYHRKPIRLLNQLWRGANALGIGAVSLEQDQLLEKACKDTGLSDFGDPRFLEPLGILLRSLEQEAALNPVGRFLQRMSIERLLRHRLYAQDLFQRHPEILERKIEAPVVVVGLARSGTTRLHRLLAADQRFAHLKAWETVNPVPLPESFAAREKRVVDPRITSIEQGLKAVLYMSPQIAAVHPLGAHEIEEEVGLIQHAFSSQIFEVTASLPSFAEWLMQHDQTYAYEYMLDLLKLVAWYRNDPLDKPWVLKTPQHMQDLDALARVLPDARLVCSHRDPVKVVGSCCSMAWNGMVRDSDVLRAETVGADWLGKIERMLRKTIRVREEMLPAENQYDVQYADITADWQGAIGGIYKFLDIHLDPAALVAMQQWLDSNSQHKHGSHKYRLEDFGLDPQQVDQRLMFYRQRYNIPYETSNPHLAPQT